MKRVLQTGGLALILAAAPAWADSPRLEQARRAVEAVDYETAQRLLLEALRDGDNSPAAVGEIYRLSARAAVVLGQRDLAEQYYRRWLAIDAGAALPADTAPKLREPFIAAQAYIAAHGRLVARAQRLPGGELEVELIADPLAMARAAIVLDAIPAPGFAAAPTSSTRSAAPPPPSAPAPSSSAGPASSPPPSAPAPSSSARPASPPSRPPTFFAGPTAPASLPASSVSFGADRRARLTAGSRAAILDENGNRLLELDATSATPLDPAPESLPASPPAETPPWPRRWSTWAIPTGAFGLVSAGFGVAALASYGRARQIADNSGAYYLADAEANVRRGRTFVWITAGAGAVTLACAIPTAIFYLRDREGGATLLPTFGGRQAGLAVVGRF